MCAEKLLEIEKNYCEENMDELGHRKRLRDKFYHSGLEALHEYERLELLLTYAIPRKDCKVLAKHLLKKFQTITGVFEASESALLSVDGVGLECVKFLKFIKALYLKEFSKISKRVSFDVEEIVNFCRSRCDFSKENFYMVMFNHDNVFLDVIEIKSEFKESVVVDMKYLLKTALIMESYSVMIAHNHLVSKKPSKEDIEFTEKFAEQLELVGIKFLDHIVFTREGYVSIKNDFENGR